jgi:hypothetical protein
LLNENFLFIIIGNKKKIFGENSVNK